ncbi:acyltransferase family protein [Proteiniphilum sp.]|uniref:acyltransferase family protein n=1 Tax=Proteiniphilum sp. TaxID=1926877 RepID=UPI002B219B1A|nr:acyltransferase family protein [Proteiniphilum sp.]MEA4917162.1 acyltransferase family protein [Proteiniphilum sp.]
MRKNYIDILKGIGIFFVVLGHVTRMPELRVFIWNFHMPLFFLISGFLYNPTKYPDFKGFFKSKFKSIYIPYVLFFLATFLYWVLIERRFRGGEYSILHQFLGLFYGTIEGNHLHFNGPLWFLPCLFLVELMFYYISRIKNKVGIIAVLIVSFTIGSLIQQYNLNILPFGLHTAFFGLVFYGIGFLSKQQENSFMNLSFLFKMMLLVGCLYVQILAVQNGYQGNIETSPIYFIPIALCGILFWAVVSLLVNKNKILEYLGINSLVIMSVHEPIYRFLIGGFSRFSGIEVDLIRTNLLYCVSISIVTIIIIIPIIYLYNKYVRKRINALFS